jgi:hypothetical protein
MKRLHTIIFALIASSSAVTGAITQVYSPDDYPIVKLICVLLSIIGIIGAAAGPSITGTPADSSKQTTVREVTEEKK